MQRQSDSIEGDLGPVPRATSFVPLRPCASVFVRRDEEVAVTRLHFLHLISLHSLSAER